MSWMVSTASLPPSPTSFSARAGAFFGGAGEHRLELGVGKADGAAAVMRRGHGMHPLRDSSDRGSGRIAGGPQRVVIRSRSRGRRPRAVEATAAAVAPLFMKSRGAQELVRRR